MYPLHQTFTEPLSEGTKFDEEKLQIELIAPEIIFGLAEVLTHGAEKYSPRNWELGMSWSRPFGALMRHMWAWWKNEDEDPESGLSHLHHAACCLMFLIAYSARCKGTDDRPNSLAFSVVPDPSPPPIND